MTGLRVLEAVVRTGSLSAAARELCVTPAAISHRLRDLEAQAGAKLVERIGGRFLPTAPGQKVLDALGDAFARIRAADAILSDRRPSTLRIVGSYSFSVLWLAPRLSRFQERFSEIGLFLEPSHSPLDQGPADITIVHAADPPENTGWTRLFADECAVVGRRGHPILLRPDTRLHDVLQGKLVNITHGRGPAWGEFSWQQWAAAHALPGHVPAKGPTVMAEHLAVDLVLAEECLALVSVVNASHLIAEGRLRALEGSAVATGCSYWTKSKRDEGRGGKPASEFIAWMRGELAAEVAGSGSRMAKG